MARLLAMTAIVAIVAMGVAAGGRTEASTLRRKFRGAAAVSSALAKGKSLVPPKVRNGLSNFWYGNPRQLDKVALVALAKKRIGGYFEEAPTPAAGLASLDDDMKTLAHNERRLVGRWLPWRSADDILLRWDEKRKAIAISLDEGMTIGAEQAEKRLQELFWEIHWELKKPQIDDKFVVRLRNLGIGTAKLPFKLSARGSRLMLAFAIGGMTAGFGISFWTPFFDPFTKQFVEPYHQQATVFAHRWFGNVRLKQQEFVTKLDALFREVVAMETVKEFTRVADKLEYGLPEEEAMQEWLKIEEALMILGKNIKGVNTMGVQEGRGNLRDLTMEFLEWGTYMGVAKINMLLLKSEIRHVEQDASLSPEARAKEKERLLLEIEQCRRQIGAALAQFRLNQILYPEYTQLSKTGDSKRLKVLRVYDELMHELGFKQYAVIAAEYYNQQLENLGIPMDARQLRFITHDHSKPSGGSTPRTVLPLR